MKNFTDSILFLLFMLLLAATAQAKPAVNPSLSTSLTYTDNLFSSNNESKDSDLIGEINPKIIAESKGARSDVKLTYRMQNVRYQEHQEYDDTRHQLDAQASNEIVNSFLYLNLGANQFQRATSLGHAPLDTSDLAPSPTTVDVLTYRLNPYIQHQFGRSSRAKLSYGYSETHYNQTLANAGDSANSNTSFSFSSGPEFQYWSWSLDYSRKIEESDRANTSDATLERVLFTNRYKITPKLALVGVAGYDKNEYTTASSRTREGNEWRLGAKWTPSRHTSLELTAGQRYYGDTLSLELAHTMKNVNLQLNYSEDVTTTNLIQGQNTAFDDQNNAASNQTSPDTISNVLLSKNLSAQVNFKQRHTTTFLKLTSSQREDLRNLRDEDVLQAKAGCNIQLSRRNLLRFNIDWLKRDYASQDRSVERSESTLGFERQLGRHIKSISKYSYADQSSSSELFTFQRNLVYLGLEMSMR